MTWAKWNRWAKWGAESGAGPAPSGIDLYWVSDSDTDWYNPDNWSTSSGGDGGAGYPGDTNDVYIDGEGTAVCTLTADAVCKNFNLIEVGFPVQGVFDQNGQALSCADFVINNDKENCAVFDAAITISGDITLTTWDETEWLATSVTTTGTPTIDNTAAVDFPHMIHQNDVTYSSAVTAARMQLLNNLTATFKGGVVTRVTAYTSGDWDGATVESDVGTWTFNNPTGMVVSDMTVTDSSANNLVDATDNCVNGGGNTNWVFSATKKDSMQIAVADRFNCYRNGARFLHADQTTDYMSYMSLWVYLPNWNDYFILAEVGNGGSDSRIAIEWDHATNTFESNVKGNGGDLNLSVPFANAPAEFKDGDHPLSNTWMHIGVELGGSGTSSGFIFNYANTDYNTRITGTCNRWPKRDNVTNAYWRVASGISTNRECPAGSRFRDLRVFFGYTARTAYYAATPWKFNMDAAKETAYLAHGVYMDDFIAGTPRYVDGDGLYETWDLQIRNDVTFGDYGFPTLLDWP